MALTKKSLISSIEVLPDGQIQVRRSDQIWEDGVMLSESYHRHVIYPGNNVDSEDARVREIATTVHTPEVIAAFKAAQAAREA
jgi:hypothetical protein